MSSRKTAAVRRKPGDRSVQRAAKLPAAEPVGPAAIPRPSGDLSEVALQLTAQVEGRLATGAADVLTPEAVQALMAAACNLYSAHVESGQQYLPLKPAGVPPTAVMATASGMLRAVNLAVFELGMWQSWTGR